MKLRKEIINKNKLVLKIFNSGEVFTDSDIKSLDIYEKEFIADYLILEEMLLNSDNSEERFNMIGKLFIDFSNYLNANNTALKSAQLKFNENIDKEDETLVMNQIETQLINI